MVSVKAAVNFYGAAGDEQATTRMQEGCKEKTPLSEMDSSWRSCELHLAKTDMDKMKEQKKFAEIDRAEAESELCNAHSVAKQLEKQIEELNSNSADSLRNPSRHDDDYTELVKQLNLAKRKLNRLKLELDSVVEAKSKAEKLVQVSRLKEASHRTSVEEIGKKIDEANEEQVLVELAKLEAEKELREIEAQRAADALRFSAAIAGARKKVAELRKEIAESKELEEMLAETSSDVNVLQNEMELVRAMARNFRNDQSEQVFPEGDAKNLLQSSEQELNSAKRELESIKEEGFRYMTSMDVIRQELALVATEAEILQRSEKKAEANVQYLNSKLLKARAQLKSVAVSEEKTAMILFSLSASLQQLQADTEDANEDRKLIEEETESIKTETKKKDSGISSAEQKLQEAMQELNAMKASEAMSLKKLSETVLAQRMLRARASTGFHGSSVTISRREYEYLNSKAAAARKVADIKVAASQAWIIALKAREEDAKTRAELIENEIEKLHERQTENTLIDREVNQEDVLKDSSRRKRESMQLTTTTRVRRSSVTIKERGVAVGLRRAKMRRISASSSTGSMRYHLARSPAVTIKRRKKVMPFIVQLLRGKRIGRHKW